MDGQATSIGNERTQLIGELYALRAGISVVAQEKEIIDKILNKAKEDCKHAEQRRIDRIAEAENNFNKVIKTFVAKQDELARAKYFSSLEYEKDRRREITNYRWYAVGNFMLGIFLIWVFPASLYFFMQFVFRLKDISSIQWRLKESTNIKKKLPHLEKEFNELQAECDRLEQVFEETKESAQNQASAETEEILDRAKTEAEQHVAAAKEYVEALEETFGNLLDPRDWENLDIFIYAIETHRADDIKSAFNYVDDERRTDRLAKVIKYAGEQISISINSGLRRLRGDLSRGFSLVSSKVTALGSGIEQQNRQLVELTDIQRMNNALTEKAAESSAELAEEVKRLRINSDYIDWRLRNNYNV